MINLKKVLLFTIILSIIFTIFSINVYSATSVIDGDETSYSEETEDELDEEDESDALDEDDASYDISNEDIEEDSSNIDDEYNDTINNYSTVSSLPEANLTLNNILNIILIALGVLMILLGIAILIRLR